MNTLALASDVQFLAAADGQSEAGPMRFTIEAYTGAAIRQSWSREPIVIDLQGMELRQKLPIVMGHDYSIGSIVGQTTSVRVEGGKLLVDAEVFASGDVAKRVRELAASGYPWQASVGADVRRHQKIDAEQTATVNGQMFQGPIRIVKASSLREVSFVVLGADANTHVSIAAEESAEPEEITMANNASESPAVEPESAPPAEITAAVAVDAPQTDNTPSDDTASVIAALTQKVETMEKLIATRDNRGPAIHVAEKASGANVIEAALCLQAGLPQPEKFFDDRTIEAGEKAKRNVSLTDAFVEAAVANGYDGHRKVSTGTLPAIIKAAFSTYDISNLLSNVANKFLLAGFNAVESSWSEISNIRSVNNFKGVNLFRLNGSFKFSRVGNGGELRSAAGTDEKRTVNADEYGVSTVITRVDLINDDLSALSQVTQRIGRGAMLSVNEVVWGEFQSGNASFYAKATAGSGNAFSMASLKAATTGYRKLNDRDGNPLGITPRVLLVPPDLELAAHEIMSSSLMISGSGAAQGNANILAGRYRVVTSAYLTSATTWWLCSDAADLAPMEVVFLNGQMGPTIEQVVPDYNTLGIGLRGTLDFGCAKGEDLAAYRMAVS